MGKKYKYEEVRPGERMVSEPALEYGLQAETEMTFSPPLTEEELADSMTTDEFIEYWCKCIDKVFDK